MSRSSTSIALSSPSLRILRASCGLICDDVTDRLGRFNLTLDSWVSHAGIFSAKIHFNQPLSVSWYNSSGAAIPLGSFSLDDLHVHSKRAYINQSVPFAISHEDNFAAFTAAMIAQPNFTWHLASESVDVRALAFPTAHGLHFSKDVTLSGMAGFSGAVQLVDFQLPGDAPGGAGIRFAATTRLANPSAFSVGLGTVVFDLSYKGVFLGRGTSPSATSIVPGDDNDVTLDGTLVPHTGNDTALALVSELFTQYLNGQPSDVLATGVSSVQPDGSAVGWLSAGLGALALHVPLQPPGGQAIAPIKAIEIEELGLAFSAGSPWAPVANAREGAVRATLELPFGFALGVGEIENRFEIETGRGVVAGLATVRGPSSSWACELEIRGS